MLKKCIFVLSFVVLLLPLIIQSNSALGACGNDDWWTPRTVPTVFYNYQDDFQGGVGSPPGNTWFTPAKWACQRSATAAPPDLNTTAEVAPNTDGPNIISPGAACSRLDIQPWSWAGAANLDCNVSANAGLFDCGVVINVCGRTDFDSSVSGYGKLNVYGGTMYAPGVWSGSPPGGQENQIGLYVGGGSSRAAACYGIVNMYNGLISVPRVAVYNGIVNLYGGIIQDTHDTDADFIITNNYARNVINIVSGKLLLRGDRTSEVATYIGNGLIIANNNRGFSSVSYDYGVTTPCYTTVTANCDFATTWNPNPTNGQLELPLSPATPLSWTPGDYVNEVNEAFRTAWGQSLEDTNGNHVFLGTSFSAVDGCNPSAPGLVTATSAYRGAFDTNFYDINGDVNSRFGPLAFNTMYYWRIDEVNVGNPSSPWKGVVWHFTTSSGKASNPYPPTDSNIGFDINKLYLRWTKGLLSDTVRGNKVFFGTDYNSVRDATTATPVIYRGETNDANYALSALSPAYTLVPEVNYYWRIDGNKAGNPLSPWVGYVWRFVFPNNYIVENFSEYASSTDLNNIWKVNLLANTCPGGGYQGPGGTLIWDAPDKALTLDYNNTGLIADCFSDARYTPFGSTNKGLDWTVSSVVGGSVKLLHVSYKGTADNNVDPIYDRMYVMIGDTNTKPRLGPTIYNPDPFAQRKTSWTDWYIKLSDLNSPTAVYPGPYPVDLTHIRYLFLGMGLRCNIYGSGYPGGHGQVTFDNIWVTQSICNSPFGPAADFTNDCFVDIQDVDIFVNDWLSSDTTLSYPSAVAPPVGPVLWYDFNETDGNIAHNTGPDLSTYLAKYLPGDSNTYDACVINNVFVDMGNKVGKVWDGNGYIKGCINLTYVPNNRYVNVPAAVLAPFADPMGPNGITFTFWLNTDDINHPVPSELPSVLSAATVGSGSSGTEPVVIEAPTADIPPQMHVVIGKTDVYVATMKHSDFGGRWNHYAVVKDADTNTLSIYRNGALLTSTFRNDIGKPLFNAIPLIFKIGERAGWDPGVVAKIDDVRMYDYALNANQVAWIATNGTGSLYMPLVIANVNGKGTANLKPTGPPEVVNFGDFAVLANQWMTEKLWP